MHAGENYKMLLRILMFTNGGQVFRTSEQAPKVFKSPSGIGNVIELDDPSLIIVPGEPDNNIEVISIDAKKEQTPPKPISNNNNHTPDVDQEAVASADVLKKIESALIEDPDVRKKFKNPELSGQG